MFKDLFRASMLGDSLGNLRDSLLGQLTGKEEPDSFLDLTRGDGGPLGVVDQNPRQKSSSKFSFNFFKRFLGETFYRQIIV